VRASTLRATAPHTLPTLLLHSTPSACITLGSNVVHARGCATVC
jgi:hypothetical protein